MPRTIREIPIADVENPQWTTGVSDELMNSIRQIGILHPIVVRELLNGRYRILAGRRRFMAAASLGYDTIPAVVLGDDVTTLSDGFITYTENMARSSNLASEIEGIRQLILEGRRLDEIQTQYNVGGSAFLNRARVAMIGTARHRTILIAALVRQTITITTAGWVAQLPANQRRVALNFITNRNSQSTTRVQIQAHLESPESTGEQLSVVAMDEIEDFGSPTTIGEQRSSNNASSHSATQISSRNGLRILDVTSDDTDEQGIPRILRWVDYVFIRSDLQTAMVPESRNFWWRLNRDIHADVVERVAVYVDDVRGTRGWASVAALLEAAEAAIPQDGTSLPDMVAGKINWLMEKLTDHYTRNVVPPALPPRTVAGVDLAAREDVRSDAVSVPSR